jgi:hypothetical protein
MSRASSVPRAADFGFTVHVSPAGPAGAASAISVESELTRLGLPGLVLRSSGRRAPNISDRRWPLGVPWSVQDRLRGDGAQKGRVLAIWQRDQVVAVCAWHLHKSGPPVIFDLGCREDLPDPFAERAAGVLLLCLRGIAGASPLSRDTSTLRWTDCAVDRYPDRAGRNRVRRAVRARAEALDFRPLRPRPRWLAGDWVTELSFSGHGQRASA